ncbi:carbohydrate ABC transporter permease [Bifidobacterium amazonense]|uniref:Carbohydrate ABC transporter permease n=1 Tax=Bifidobacterium amazonense TaxID=2809027 RepID=A0ABS9VX50_9BIFI|nr:carbohydrate ABC transporter permease [Bifidobacterium amazonense]MCH9276654.1 carbohydrate ABC transporter permease [Bifidobacterium amazonense]
MSQHTSRTQTATERKPIFWDRLLRQTWVTIVAVFFCLIWFFPVYWMLITSMKPRGEMMSTNPTFWPQHPTLLNFQQALFATNFFINLKNSVIVTFFAVIFSIIVAFLACSALTQYRFRARKGLMILILAIQMIPGTALLIPMFIVFNQLGLLDKYAGLILAYIAGTLPFSIWNMRGFFLAVPDDIFEAAKVDGASDWKILWKITFPLVAPGVVSTSVFAFINAWNDYLTAYTFMKDQNRYTLPLWLASFSTPLTGTDYGGQMAGSVIFSLPVVVFFMLVQHNMVKGITAGATKG